MTILESIFKELQNLPLPKLVEVAGYVHQLNEEAQQERLAGLRQTFGALDEKDGQAFADALTGARHVEG